MSKEQINKYINKQASPKTMGMRYSSPFIQLTVLLQLKPVLLIMFDISLISFIYTKSIPTAVWHNLSF